MAAHRASSAPSSSGRRRFLLVVDSDVRSLFATTTLLQRMQYNIWSARSAAEALEMATVAVPALLILAQNLPDMSSVEFVKQFKQYDLANSTPIVMLTQRADPASERACLAAGALTCLTIPINAENLYRVVQMATEPLPRMNIRISTKLSVTVNNQTVECVEGECASVLSEYGVYVRTLEPRPLNSKLPVRIQLAGGAITADAVVIHSHRAGTGPRDEPGMGLQFIRISEQDQERIRCFIKDELTRGIN